MLTAQATTPPFLSNAMKAAEAGRVLPSAAVVGSIARFRPCAWEMTGCAKGRRGIGEIGGRQAGARLIGGGDELLGVGAGVKALQPLGAQHLERGGEVGLREIGAGRQHLAVRPEHGGRGGVVEQRRPHDLQIRRQRRRDRGARRPAVRPVRSRWRKAGCRSGPAAPAARAPESAPRPGGCRIAGRAAGRKQQRHRGLHLALRVRHFHDAGAAAAEPGARGQGDAEGKALRRRGIRRIAAIRSEFAPHQGGLRLVRHRIAEHAGGHVPLAEGGVFVVSKTKRLVANAAAGKDSQGRESGSGA